MQTEGVIYSPKTNYWQYLGWDFMIFF
jgi:hypothetical protein